MYVILSPPGSIIMQQEVPEIYLLLIFFYQRCCVGMGRGKFSPFIFKGNFFKGKPSLKKGKGVVRFDNGTRAISISPVSSFFFRPLHLREDDTLTSFKTRMLYITSSNLFLYTGDEHKLYQTSAVPLGHERHDKSAFDCRPSC